MRILSKQHTADCTAGLFCDCPGAAECRLGSLFLKKLQAMCIEQQKQLILEVENPDYETREDKKVLMHRRIAFYQKTACS